MLLFRYRGGWYTGCLHLQDLSPRNKWNLNKFIVYFLGTFDSVTSLLSLMSVWGWLVGRTICLIFLPKKAGSYTAMLLSEHLSTEDTKY